MRRVGVRHCRRAWRPSGKGDDEGGAAALARGQRADGAAVQLGELLDEREADAQPAVSAGAGGVGLAEAVEHVGEEVGVNRLGRCR